MTTSTPLRQERGHHQHREVRQSSSAEVWPGPRVASRNGALRAVRTRVPPTLHNAPVRTMGGDDRTVRKARRLLPRRVFDAATNRTHRRAAAVRLARPDHPRGLRRHDRQRQDGPVPVAARRGRHRRHSGDLHRSQGRPRQPDADLSAAGSPRTSTLGGCRRSRAQGASAWTSTPRRWPTQWRKGLAEWDQPPERIARFREAVDVAIYTPGAETGLPLSVLRSLAPPPPEKCWPTAARCASASASVVSGLLTLLGRDADPLQSREHILLSNLLDRRLARGPRASTWPVWSAQRAEAAARQGSARSTSRPSIPAKERLELALADQQPARLARFATWTRASRWMRSACCSRPRASRASPSSRIAHLSDAERMFVVTLLLNEMIAWMRQQSGHLVAARDALHGRDLRLLPADRECRRRSRPCSRC